MKKFSSLLVVLMLMLASLTANAQVHPRGDVDQDGRVNISDVTCLIDYLLKGSWPSVKLESLTSNAKVYRRGDVDQDGRVNISDVTCLIDYLLKGTWPDEPLNSSLDVSPIEINFGVVMLGTDKQESFTVTNTSDEDVTFMVDASTRYTDRFEVTNNLEYFTLTPGSIKTYTVTSHGQESGYEFFTEVYVIYQEGDTAATVKLSSIGDDDQPLIDQTSLTINVGESAMAHAKTSYLTAEENVDGIVDYYGFGDATGSGRPDGHNSISREASLELTFIGLNAGTVTITFQHELTGETADLIITVLDSEHEYVDLGLPSGTLWATCNIGANAPEDYGDYFAWGETEPKEVYDGSKWYMNSYYDTDGNFHSGGYTKYCTNSSDGYNGFTDGKTELDPEDDAAYINWGPSWRMPTWEQLGELINSCTWQWTTRNGVNGQLGTGPNGNTIFLPAAGSRCYVSLNGAGSLGYYWSRTLYPDNTDFSWRLNFDSDYPSWDGCSLRYFGHTVRAVYVP